MEIIFATNNKHKLEEVNFIAKPYGVTFVAPPEGFNPDESGETFEENSYIKAYEASKLCNQIALADDSGLCVAALNGAPGIHSARYAETAEKRIEKLVKELSSYADKSAKFVCCMTLVTPAGDILHQVIGECKGNIIDTPKGGQGFGYDPIFIPDGYSKTLAELGEDVKNSISHRSNALRQILDLISNS